MQRSGKARELDNRKTRKERLTETIAGEQMVKKIIS